LAVIYVDKQYHENPGISTHEVANSHASAEYMNLLCTRAVSLSLGKLKTINGARKPHEKGAYTHITLSACLW
jgi:hypothetical protein